MKRFYFVSTTILIPLILVLLSYAKEQKREIQFQSLSPEKIFTKIDLTRAGLSNVKEAVKKDNRIIALKELRAYYREQYSLPPKSDRQSNQFDEADDIVNHIFQWGPYEAADYGEEMNWEWDPRGDIEWVAAVYRFYWARTLANAYQATRDEKYAKAFVELTADWIRKHPLEKHRKTHPVYTYWRGFAWLDIQTGIRAQSLCRAFKIFVHTDSFTPEFLGIFLASIYDHQVKTEKLPMGKIHNKAIFEQRGVIDICSTFPEFKESEKWMELALERTEETFLAQTTSDGVQREWSGGYHLGVLRDAVEIMQQAEAFGTSVSKAYRERVKRMYDYIFAIATPDLGFTMFGDASRPIDLPNDRSKWPLFNTLMEASTIFDDPKYKARAELDRNNLPEQKSYAFPEAGMYVLRNEWGPEQIYFAFHCSPPAISGHDQPDNGTFELYAYGRWLMPDTGYYTYGHNAKARAWHRQTNVHQTLTLDGKDTKVAATQLIHHFAPNCDTIVVENQSYENLTHRRTVWFVNKQFFVLLDEAIGDAEGNIDLHFQFAPAEVDVSQEDNWAATSFDDANILVWEHPNAPVEMEEEQGWFAWKYGKRKPRTAFRFRHRESSPIQFLTVLVPYQGTGKPIVDAGFNDEFDVGNPNVNVFVQVNDQKWEIGRDIDKNSAWCSIKE